jgi:hypothetical protein
MLWRLGDVPQQQLAATQLRYRGQAMYLCVLNCASGTPQLPLMGGRRLYMWGEGI